MLLDSECCNSVKFGEYRTKKNGDFGKSGWYGKNGSLENHHNCRSNVETNRNNTIVPEYKVSF